jgi:hypothetical protein
VLASAAGALSERIGHSDVAFTTKHYVQHDLKADRQVANTLAELIIGGLASTEVADDEGARSRSRPVSIGQTKGRSLVRNRPLTLVSLVRSSSLKERAGVKGGFGLQFCGGMALGGMAAWPYGWLSLIGAGFVRAGWRVRDRAEPGRGAASQASLTRWSASR